MVNIKYHQQHILTLLSYNFLTNAIFCVNFGGGCYPLKTSQDKE